MYSHLRQELNVVTLEVVPRQGRCFQKDRWKWEQRWNYEIPSRLRTEYNRTCGQAVANGGLTRQAFRCLRTSSTVFATTSSVTDVAFLQDLQHILRSIRGHLDGKIQEERGSDYCPLRRILMAYQSIRFHPPRLPQDVTVDPELVTVNCSAVCRVSEKF